MSALLKVPQLNAVFFESLPNNCFPNAVVFGDVPHAHLSIKAIKLLFGRIEVTTTARNSPGNTEFYEPLSNGLGINSKH